MLVNAHKLKFIVLTILGIGIMNVAQAQSWSLEQCLDSAMVHNKKLQISTNEISRFNEKEKEVKSNLLPKITANGDYKYFFDLPTQLMPQSVFGGPEGVYKEAQFGVPHNINANLQLSMPLYSPELYGGIKTVKIASEVAVIQKEKTAEQIYFDISNLYYNAQIINSQLDFIEGNLTNSKQLLENVNLLHNQLLLTQADVDKVALQVQQLETMKLSAQSKNDQVINGLKLQMGVSLTNDFSINAEIKQGTSIAYATKPSLDFRLAETKNGLLNAELSTLKNSRYLPTIALYGSYGTVGYGYDGEPKTFLDFYPTTFGGLKISIPIFNGNTTNKKISQKRLEIQNIELQKGLINDQYTVQIQNAKLQMNAAQQTITSSELQINLAQSVYDQVLLQNKEGLASLTEVLLADNAIRSAQQQYLSSLIDYLKAELELKKYTGNLK